MLNNISFEYHKISRMLSILPRKSKRVRLLYFDHANQGNQVTLKYRFSNAVYYKVGERNILGKSVTLPMPEEGTTVNFTVYGFFRKNEYTITLTQDDAILTRVSQLNTIPNTAQPAYAPGSLLAS